MRAVLLLMMFWGGGGGCFFYSTIWFENMCAQACDVWQSLSVPWLTASGPTLITGFPTPHTSGECRLCPKSRWRRSTETPISTLAGVVKTTICITGNPTTHPSHTQIHARTRAHKCAPTRARTNKYSCIANKD